MITTTNREFMSLVSVSRSLSRDEFIRKMPEYSTFQSIVDVLEIDTKKFSDEIGKSKAKPVDVKPEEEVWRKFFQDHEFYSAEDARNWSDGISILTGIDVNKFLKFNKSRSRSHFPPNIVIVPVGNSNSHNYRKGTPIINLGHGTVFHKMNGVVGNNMSTSPDDFRFPERSEIEEIVGWLLYSSEAATEYLVYTLRENV